MNYLAMAQLINLAFQIIGEANHSKFSNNFVNEIKKGLEEMQKFLQTKNEEQVIEQKKQLANEVKSSITKENQ